MGLSLPTALTLKAETCPFPVPNFPMVTNLLVLNISGLWKVLRLLNIVLTCGQVLLASSTRWSPGPLLRKPRPWSLVLSRKCPRQQHPRLVLQRVVA